MGIYVQKAAKIRVLLTLLKVFFNKLIFASRKKIVVRAIANMGSYYLSWID